MGKKSKSKMGEGKLKTAFLKISTKNGIRYMQQSSAIDSTKVEYDKDLNFSAF